ncbi:LINE-1 type transposase domain-containing protein 1 [Psammomys obesus]|uniref:LINE-1 type transposase domain-containing protein 1 n=1 Tax=Psammomys obesus TaxID=48139 RepID=UPI00245320BF|nr:LINE-1 type transposase domain-containing protein 1 [Psammomys obesus]
MSGVHSKAARLQKEQKEKPLLDTEREMAASVDLKYNDVSAVMMKKFNALMEMQDMMFVEMRESLKNDLKEMLVKRTSSPEAKGSGDGTERGDSASGWPKPGEKAAEESSGTDEDSGNLTARGEEKSKPDGKQDKGQQPHSSQVVNPSPERMEEALHRADGRVQGLAGEDAKDGEDQPAPDASSHNAESLPAGPRDEGAPEEGGTLRLAADFSAATLDVGKRWGRVFRLLGERGLEPELQCTLQLAFKCDGEAKTFSDLHSLRQFASRKLFLKELLKDVFPPNEAASGGPRRNELQERAGKTLADTKHEAGRIASDSLGFLFIKEVKVASPEAKTYQKERLEQKDKKTLKKQRASRIEGEKETPEGITVVEELGIEKFSRSGEEVGLISLVVDSESEEEENRKMSSRTKKKETFHELKELAFSYLVWDSKGKKLVKCQEAYRSREGGAAAVTRQETGTPCLTLYLASPSESLQAGSDGPKSHPYTNVSVPSPPLLMDLQRGRYKTPQIEELTADLIHETEENFRRSVMGCIRQMQREVENIKKLYFFDVLNIKSSMDDLNSLACMIEARVSEQEDAVEGLTKETMQLAKEIVGKERLREREDRLRSSNIRVIGIPEKENRENGAEDIIKEVIEENFAELEEQGLEIISAHRIPNSVDEHRLTPRHILVKFWSAGDKQKILKASRAKKEITYRGSKIRLTADLSPGTIDARSQWSSIIKVLQEEGFQPRILYPAKLAFEFKGKTKIFFDIEEFKKFISDIPFLKEPLSNVL